jgi:N-acylneuraminate cytidylyltransferase/CMP-N,N'-diacetyllegionaminic acid synthase
LVDFKARSTQKSSYCARLVISTDASQIQDESAACGVKVPFTRPAHLASDTASSDDVVLHAIDYFETVEKRQFDAVMLLGPSTSTATASMPGSTC